MSDTRCNCGECDDRRVGTLGVRKVAEDFSHLFITDLEFLLHSFYSLEVFHRFHAQAYQISRAKLQRLNLIERVGEGNSQVYQCTARGKVLVERLRNTPLPIATQAWKFPDGYKVESDV